MGAVCPFLETDGDDTMRKAAEKLKNRRGASLMVALLLFLVCAVVGSAVLVAGTAASGRMSKIAETDRRYYSVNSAAGLLIDLLDGKTVTIKETAAVSGTKSYEVKEADGAYYPVGGVGAPLSWTLPLKTACDIAELWQSGNVSTGMELKLSAPDGPAPLSAILSGRKDGSEAWEIYPTVIIETIQEDGRLRFAVSSDDYILNLNFAVEKKNGTPRVIGTSTVTETSITWKLSDVI